MGPPALACGYQFQKAQICGKLWPPDRLGLPLEHGLSEMICAGLRSGLGKGTSGSENSNVILKVPERAQHLGWHVPFPSWSSRSGGGALPGKRQREALLHDAPQSRSAVVLTRDPCPRDKTLLLPNLLVVGGADKEARKTCEINRKMVKTVRIS